LEFRILGTDLKERQIKNQALIVAALLFSKRPTANPKVA
jgi:hypothetical protein